MASVAKLHRSDELAREMGDRDAERLKAAMETETQAAEREQRMSEVNIFTLDPNGFKTHWKIVSGTTGDELNKMMQHQGVLSKWLHEHHYKPDDMGRGNGHSAPVAASQAATGAVEAKPCPQCGGPTEYKTGKKDDGGTWAGWFCLATAKAPKNLRHKAVWE